MLLKRIVNMIFFGNVGLSVCIIIVVMLIKIL